ncbi:MAG: FkbM family methyltransferase [Pedobacter agri]
MGSFKISLNTRNFIDACIYYTGDYEPYLKMQFKQLINPGDVILDVGANIGFHTLYFAELVGTKGKVFAFEPITANYSALIKNVQLNSFPQVSAVNRALGNANQLMDIHIDNTDQNPGTFSLLEAGVANTTVECIKGDDYIIQQNIQNVNFIKVDVEGFEVEVLKGLSNTIRKHNPIIIFEYDSNYQSKVNKDSKAIFHLLSDLNYNFSAIDGYGKRRIINLHDHSIESEILALPLHKI